MSDLNKLWIVEDDSQEPVEFNEPTPPPCGFHSISPAQLDFQVPGAVPGTLWTPNLGRAQPVPATPPDHSDRTGTCAGGSDGFWHGWFAFFWGKLSMYGPTCT